MVLLKQCTYTPRDSHDATRHKSRRTLAYSIQQFHPPFHLQFVTLDMCSQDSQCDPTAETHSNICMELLMYHFCACFGESVFALIPDHEVRAAKLTNRWISGCWWGRDASSDEHLLGTKYVLLKCRSVRREPKRTKTTSVTDNENLADWMDEDNFRRTLGTSHPLELVGDEKCQRRHGWREMFFTSGLWKM